MILKTKEFQEACKNILIAVDNNIANLEVVVRENNLYLNVTNKEYYVAVKFALENPEEFKAVVEAQLFLNLIAGITTDTFELKIKDNTVVVKSGKSNYKLPMIYENDTLIELPPIVVNNKMVEMNISTDILYSILNTNSREITKIKKNANVNELQRLYYIDETGCFTFTTGACLNAFSLEQPVKLLLNDRIVKLFKLFKEDAHFALGEDPIADGSSVTKVVFETENVYLAALVTNDARLLNKVLGPCAAAKQLIKESYSVHLVLSVNNLNSALNRLMLFAKNSNETQLQANITINGNEVTFADANDNAEVIESENGSFVAGRYDMKLNLTDLKLVLDSCKAGEYITLNCGNQRSVVVTHGAISNLIPEGTRA